MESLNRELGQTLIKPQKAIDRKRKEEGRKRRQKGRKE